MKNKTTRFLLGSLIGVVLLCVGVFTFFSLHMSAQSSRAINEVGTLYMSSMSQQISIHFESIINLQLAEPSPPSCSPATTPRWSAGSASSPCGRRSTADIRSSCSIPSAAWAGS